MLSAVVVCNIGWLPFVLLRLTLAEAWGGENMHSQWEWIKMFRLQTTSYLQTRSLVSRLCTSQENPILLPNTGKQFRTNADYSITNIVFGLAEASIELRLRRTALKTPPPENIRRRFFQLEKQKHKCILLFVALFTICDLAKLKKNFIANGNYRTIVKLHS